MTWTEKDEVLFSIINIFGKEHLEAQINDASEKFSRLKKRPDFFVIFGYYELKKDTYFWQNEMNKISYDFVKNNYMSLFNSDVTIKKIFQPEVKFNKKDMNVIPYFMKALNAKFQVIRFKSPTAYIYALTTIEGVKETFKYDDFDVAMIHYRFYNDLSKANKVKNIDNRSKHNKHTIKRHTHRNKRKE
jgi:hypothetical protein